MPRRVRTATLLLIVPLLVAACAPSPTPAMPGQPQARAPVAARPESTLVVAVRVEPASIAARALRTTFVNLKTSVRLFNAGLDLIDDRNAPRPYLAQALPQLNTDTWRVLPDGRMETVYRLKPNLTWHDGSRLTADDFVFAWTVYATPELGTAASLPFSVMEEVLARDERTAVIRWRRLYAYAGVLQATGTTSEFPPLPRHILQETYNEAQWEAFVNHPYWTSEFVGAGPYRVERWDHGTAIDGLAFDGHVLGRPRISRVRIVFVNDQNAALANLLSEAVHWAADDSLGFQQLMTAKREWAPRNGGSTLVTTDLFRGIYSQFRPDLVTAPAILDARVRKALAHAIDKQPLNEALYEGEGILAETILPPGVDYYPAVERALVRYPYDLRRAEELLNEVGFRKGADGSYLHPTQGRLSIELKSNASARYDTERSVVASGWRQAGIDVQEVAVPAAQSQDPVVRATFPSLYAYSGGVGERALLNFATSTIPRAENRWTGANRGGWASVEFESLFDRFNTTLEPSERVQRLAEIARLLSDELPSVPLYYDLGAVAHVAALRGPRPAGFNATGMVSWNVHEWELQ